MARPSSSVQRNLTLMEELEKLEQSITLTLQGTRRLRACPSHITELSTEIDSNFSRAHRIVTSSILPVVDDYAKHSENVWESSKVWGLSQPILPPTDNLLVLEAIFRGLGKRLAQ